MKTGKKLLALLLAVVMTMSMMTVGVFAEEPVDETQNSVEEPQNQEPETPAEQTPETPEVPQEEPAETLAEGNPTLETDIGDQTFIVGQTTKFTFTTTKGNYTGGNVCGISNFSDTEGNEAAVKTLEFKQGNEWIDMKGQSFGGGKGFPLTDATSTFRVAFNKAGTYTFTAYMMPVGETDYAKAVCSTEVTFEVKETPKVAQVGREQFETLQAAINAAENGSIVELLEDITEETQVQIPKEKNITIDLNGKTLTSTVNGAALVNNGTLRLQDTAGNGKIESKIFFK